MNLKTALLGLTLSLTLLLQGCFPIVATGIVGGGFVATDRRTSGAQLEDAGIEMRASHALDDRFHDQIHVNCNSYNRILLLTGEVPDQKTLKEVDSLARSTTNLRSVVNQLKVGLNRTVSERADDVYLEGKVRAHFLSESNGRFSAVQTKIVVKDSVVYLMGLVTKDEATAASNVASTTSGVKKVVRVFEYIAHIPDNEKPLPQNGDEQKKSTSSTSQDPQDKPQKPAPESEVLPAASPMTM
jgi:osmotically-inducible protein OsmY